MIDNEKGDLHTSLKTFKNPIFKIKTKIYLIRIDELSDYNYRYAAWKVNENETSKPDLVLNNGQIQYEGSGGNYVITFVNGIYTYKVYRNVIGSDTSPDITLEVEENGIIILTYLFKEKVFYPLMNSLFATAKFIWKYHAVPDLIKTMLQVSLFL